MNASRFGIALATALLASGTAHADDGLGIRAEIQQELAQARQDVRRDLARERHALQTDNLRLDGSRIIGQRGDATARLARAEITPAGDLLIAGKAQPIDITQRRHLLAHRGLVIEIAKAGIDIGERAAHMAIDAVDMPVMALMFSAMTGGVERRVERMVKREVEPVVLALCNKMPALRASEQRIAAGLPAFRPYATTTDDDVRSCRRDALDAFASL